MAWLRRPRRVAPLLNPRTTAALPPDGWRTVSWIVLAAALLCVPAIINGFPFVYPDSGDYLVFTPHLHRSPFYAVLIFPVHLYVSPWPVALFHSLIIAHLIYLLVRAFLDRFGARVYLLTIATLLCFTSLPWVSGQIMPDILTSVMMLSIFIIGFYFDKLSMLERLYLTGLLTVSIASHVSHVTAAAGLVLLVALLLALARVPTKQIAVRLACIVGPLAASAAAFVLYHAVIHGTVALAPAGQTFLMASLIEKGPARRYLQTACPEAGHRICAYADELPSTAFGVLWGGNNVLEPLGGFKGMEDESAVVVRRTIEAYPWDVLRVSLASFGRQLVNQAPAAHLVSYLEEVPSLTELIELLFGPDARQAYVTSLQSTNSLPYEVLRWINAVAMLASLALAALILFIAIRRGARDITTFFVFIACCILGNAFMTGVVSGLYARLQARVSWLLVLAVVLGGAALYLRSPRRDASRDLTSAAPRRAPAATGSGPGCRG